MIRATATVEGFAPLQFGRYHEADKLEKESNDDYEARTWLEKLHVDKDGQVFIPPMAFKRCLDRTAKYLSKQIKGKNRQTYTKHFESGVFCQDPVLINETKEGAKKVAVFGDSQGKRGGKSGSRVKKYFPTFPEWKGEVVFYILDETITEEVFKEHLEEAGKFTGIGVFRPENGGYYGRFTVENLEWERD